MSGISSGDGWAAGNMDDMGEGPGFRKVRQALGVLATGGALGGVALANALPERALEVSFAMLQLFVAFQLARRALRNEGEETA